MSNNNNIATHVTNIFMNTLLDKTPINNITVQTSDNKKLIIINIPYSGIFHTSTIDSAKDCNIAKTPVNNTVRGKK